jgi:uncharacterized membrane protein
MWYSDCLAIILPVALLALIVSGRYLYVARREKNETGIVPKYYNLYVMLCIVSALVIVSYLIVLGFVLYFFMNFT